MLSAGPAAGQTVRTIKGVVTDTAGAPLSGVLVRAAQGNASALTGGTGTFALRTLNATKQIVTTHLGFRDDTVTVSDTGIVMIRLQAITLSLQPLVVSAERNQKAASERVLRDLDIQLRPRESAQELLRLTPGLVIAQHAGGGSWSIASMFGKARSTRAMAISRQRVPCSFTRAIALAKR